MQNFLFMRIIYLGNFLSNHSGFYAGPNVWLVKSLEKSGHCVYFASDKINKLRRFIDFMNIIWKERKSSELVLIDTYSTQAFNFALIASWLCRVLGLKYVPILHGGNLPKLFDKSRYKVVGYLSNASAIIAPSGYLKEMTEIRDLGNPIIIPNPLEIDYYKFLHRRKCNAKLLWVRSLQEIYNPYMALEVLIEIKKLDADAHLFMVGPDKGSMLNDLLSFAKKNYIQDNVTFTGKLSVDEWTTLSEKCDIFINTTNIDNTPVSLIEAMALGLPIVSTNVGGIPYLVKDDKEALLSNADDTKAMVTSIKRLIANPDIAASISLNGRILVEKSYDSDSVLTKWLEMLSGLNKK